MKTCTCCSEQKPREMFHRRTQSADGLALICTACQKKYKQENKEKIAITKKKYREANKEKIAQSTKSYVEANKDKIAKRRKAYVEANKERIAQVEKQYRIDNAEKVAETLKNYREANREQILARQKAYRERNKALRTSLERKRQASKMHRTPSWLTEFDKLKIKCLYQVAAMRTRESGQKWHVDHIIPLQGKLVSGLHVPSNLRVITAFENIQKHNNFLGIEA